MTDLYTQPGIVPNFNRLNPSPTVPTIIGLSGYARSGKDTVGEIITRLYGHERASYAAALKALAYDVNPWAIFPTTDKVRLQEVVDNIGWEEAKAHDEVRRLLQEIGTRARQHLGDNVWVDAAFYHLDTPERPLEDRLVVFTDVRFPNEALRIKDEGGVVLRVKRPGINAVNGHVSEHALDDWPFDEVVINDGTLVDLEGEVQRVLGEFDG